MSKETLTNGMGEKTTIEGAVVVDRYEDQGLTIKYCSDYPTPYWVEDDNCTELISYHTIEEAQAYVDGCNANVNLDLLEALKVLADYSDKAIQELCDRDTGWYYQLKAALSKAEQTIAKAEGGDG